MYQWEMEFPTISTCANSPPIWLTLGFSACAETFIEQGRFRGGFDVLMWRFSIGRRVYG